MSRTTLGILLGIVMVAQVGFAPISAPASLAQLQQSADLIVVGSASGGIQAGGSLNFTIQVSRVVKGDLLPAISIPASWQASDPGFAMAVSGNGLWFLRRSVGEWRVLPLQSGFATFKDAFIPMPAGPVPDAYAYDATAATVSDKVASEISVAVESGDSLTLFPGLQGFWLDELRSPVVQILYHRMAASSSTQQKFFGLSGLIRAGDAAALVSAIDAAPRFSSSRLEYGILLSSIRNEFRASDARSVAILGGAATDSGLPLDLRESAAFALRGIHTKDALPYLATLLDDPDTKLQAEGVGGLGSFANSLPMQTTACMPSLSCLQMPEHAVYKTQDTIAHFAMGERTIAQLSFWKSWWSQNRIALGY